MSFAGDVGTLLSKIQQQESNAQMLSQIRADAKALTEAARRVEASSSGSNFGYHSELYYIDFEKPPAGHRFNVEWGCVNVPQPGNAAYWYNRAGKPVSSGPLDAEWVSITTALLL